MRNKLVFIIGLLCGAVLFGGTAVLANSGILAQITSQVFFLNGQQIELFAYNINGSNYIKIRDAAELFGADIGYLSATNSVYISTNGKPVPNDSATDTDSEESSDKEPDIYIEEDKVITEDYSKYANPDIFDEVYTKEAYNAMRQSIADTKAIITRNDENGFNSAYKYAHFIDERTSFESQGETEKAMQSVTAILSGYYKYTLTSDPTVRDIYKYPGYRILTVEVNQKFQDANNATDEFADNISSLSDKEKLKRIADYITDRIVYKDENVAEINEIFTSPSPVNGICGTYVNAFLYLCQRLDIPCIVVKDNVHAWNVVYIDNEWHTVDISYYDVARTEEALLPSNYPRLDTRKERTEFAKELLVPGSTIAD